MSFQRLSSANTDSSLTGKLDGYLDQRQLPMYKDKPHDYVKSRKATAPYRRWGAIALVIVTILYWSGIFTPFKGPSSSELGEKATKHGSKSNWSWKSGTTAGPDWDDRREKVKEAFIKSWDGYEKYAWGKDVYHPLSKEGAQMNSKSTGMGWIIVDALDTLMLMNLTSRLSHARTWITTSLNYDQDVAVNTFETTIRMLGGLLSAHYLSTEFPHMAPLEDDDHGAAGEDLYLEKATDLAERLMGAFDSNSGVPFASVNLQTSKGLESHADGGASSTAEATTLQLEFKYLALLTGEKHFWERAEKVMQVVDKNNREDGLLPIFIHPTTGTFYGENIRLGSRGDSYYEYLIKQYLQTQMEEQIYYDMWNQSLAGVRKHLITYTSHAHLTVLGERPDGLGGKLSSKMDHLVCFYPGTIALGVTRGRTIAETKAAGEWNNQSESEMELARQLTKTCWGMYKVMATGLAPEIAHFQLDDPAHLEQDGILTSEDLSDDFYADWRQDYIIKHNDNHNLQRPETIESLFYMWRITGDAIYREWGWEIFQRFMQYTNTDDDAGYTSLAHANEDPPILMDNMESFWLAETLKYFYLLFSPDDYIPLDSVVFNTEGHIFPRFKLARGLKTGWERHVDPKTDEDVKATDLANGSSAADVGTKKTIPTKPTL